MLSQHLTFDTAAHKLLTFVLQMPYFSCHIIHVAGGKVIDVIDVIELHQWDGNCQCIAEYVVSLNSQDNLNA